MTDPLPFPERRRRWRPWLLGLGLSLLLMLAVGAAAYLYWRHGVHRRLAEALAALDAADPGWRLADIEKARAEIPEAENNAQAIIATRVRIGSQEQAFAELAAQVTRLPPVEQLPPALLTRADDELNRAREAMEGARKLAGLPRGRHTRVFHRNPLEILLGHVQDSIAVTRLLVCDSARRAHAGDGDGAASSCRAALNAGRSIGDEPFVISQLHRIDCSLLACGAAERILGQGVVSDDELRRLQLAFADEADHPGFFLAVRGERAVLNDCFNLIESGEMTSRQVAGDRNPPSWLESLSDLYIPNQLQVDHVELFELFDRELSIVRLPPHERKMPERELGNWIRTAPRNFATLLFPNFERVERNTRQILAYLRCATAALAAERYRQARGRWPDSLEKLTPDLLPAVPTDPNDGNPIRYKRLDDGAVVYSVGEDGGDDGGKIDHESPDRPGTDIGFRLWDVGHRRRPPAGEAKP